MEKQIISTPNAPAAVGPYSQAVRCCHFVYTAGQIGLDPQTGKMVEGGVVAQAEQVMKNLAAVLEAAGSSLSQVVKTTIFLRYMKDFAAVNEVYARYIGEEKPARSTVAVAALPLGALVEIEIVALVPEEETEPEAQVASKGKSGKKKNKKGKKK